MADSDKELKIRIGTEADVAGAKRAEDAIAGVGRAAEKASNGTKTTGAAAQTTAQQLGQLKQSGGEVAAVFNGLQAAGEGGTRGLIGMLNAGRGVVGLFRSIGSVLAGPVGLGLGAAAAGIAYLGRIARQNQTAIEKVFTESGKSADQLKTKYRELEQEGKKSLEAQIAEVNRLADAYQRLGQLMSEVEQRNARLNEVSSTLALAELDLEEQTALAKATTPEQRERVTKDFAQRRSGLQRSQAAVGRENQRYSATLRRDTALEEQLQQDRILQGERARATEARRAADDAVALSRDWQQRAPGSPEALEALRNAQALGRAADIAEQNFRAVAGQTTRAGEQAAADERGARSTLQQVDVQELTATAQQGTEAMRAASRPAVADTSALESDIASAMTRRNALDDELFRRPGLSTDPRNAQLASGLEAENANLARLTAQLIETQRSNQRLQAESLRTQQAIARETAQELDKQKRQQSARRSYEN